MTRTHEEKKITPNGRMVANMVANMVAKWWQKIRGGWIPIVFGWWQNGSYPGIFFFPNPNGGKGFGAAGYQSCLDGGKTAHARGYFFSESEGS